MQLLEYITQRLMVVLLPMGSYHFWKVDVYLEASEQDDLAKFIECGCMIYQTEQNNYLDKVIKRAGELNIPHDFGIQKQSRKN